MACSRLRFCSHQAFIQVIFAVSCKIFDSLAWHRVDPRFQLNIFIHSSADQNIIPHIGNDTHIMFAGILVKPGNDMRRKRALVYDLTGFTVDDPASVKGKQITAVSSQLQLIRIAAHARCRSARCKDHFMSALHNMDNAALCFRRDLLLGICQCSVNIQYQYFCFHFVSSVFFFCHTSIFCTISHHICNQPALQIIYIL